MIAEAMIMIDEDYDEDHNDDNDVDNHPVRLLLPTGQPLLVRCAPFIGIKMIVRLFIGDLHSACCHVQVHDFPQDIHDTDDDNADNYENDNNRI